MLLSGRQILRRHPVAAAASAARAWHTPGTLTIRTQDSGPSVSDDSRESILVLQDVKRRLVPAMRMQYMQVAGQPGARGKMIVSWTVLPDGAASNIVVGENTVGSPELQRRALALVSRWRYPSARQAVSVSFPFIFG